jgi:hypothetical protein
LLILLPVSVYLLAFLTFMGIKELKPGEATDWRLAALEAAVVWGVVVVISAELLSLFEAITQLSLAIVWAALAVILSWLGIRHGRLKAGWRNLRALGFPLRGADLIYVGVLAAFGLVLLLVGFITPPSNSDALMYHMARVVHWAQDQSLRHYAATHHSQLMRPFWAELTILHLRVLWGSDTPAKLVQWASMAGSVMAATGLVAMFGGSRRFQILGAAAVMGVPMGILQSTSTQNDYVAGFWAVCLAYFVVLSKKRELSILERVLLAGSVGIGVLTKGTFFVYSLPLLVWYFVPRLFKAGFLKFLADGLLVGGLVVCLNLGLWIRNIETYGGPYGPSDAIQRSLGIRYFLPQLHLGGGTQAPDDPAGGALPEGTGTRTATGTAQSVSFPEGQMLSAIPSLSWEDTSGPAAQLLDKLAEFGKRIIQMLGWNMVTPSSWLNEQIQNGMMHLPGLFDSGYIAIMNTLAWNHEDSAGNPVQVLLVPIMLVPLVIAGLRSRQTLPVGYAVVALAGYALLPIVVSAGGGPWGIRYQLPFFLLWAPVVGITLIYFKPRWMTHALIILFMLLTVPYLLLNNTRPIIGHRPWPTRTESIFVADKADLLLALVPEAKQSFVGATDVVKELDCKQVGLRLNSSELEYAFWWLMGAPQNGVRMENLYTYPVLEKYIDKSFKPCAIICTICGERTTLHGLPLVANFGYSRVFAGSTFTPDEGD